MTRYHVDNFLQCVFGISMESIYGAWLWPLLLPFSADFESLQSAGLSQRQLLSGSETERDTCSTKGIPWLPNVRCRVPRVYRSTPSCFNRVIILSCQASYHDCAFPLSSPQMPSTMTWLCKHCDWFCRGRLSRSQFMILSIIAGEPPLFECVPLQYQVKFLTLMFGL